MPACTEKADLEFVSADAEFDPENCVPPASATAPADNKVSCQVTLGPDGNARLYLTFRVLPPSGNPQACVPGTNVVNTDGASSAAEGGDQAQYEICPEGSLSAAAGAAAAAAAAAAEAGTPAGGTAALPDAAVRRPDAPTGIMGLVLLISAGALAITRRTGTFGGIRA